MFGTSFEFERSQIRVLLVSLKECKCKYKIHLKVLLNSKIFSASDWGTIPTH
jgi:hypothetical protein